MPIQTLLGRLVVIRGYLEGAVSPRFLGGAGEIDRLVGCIGASASQHGYPPCRLFDDNFDNTNMLLHRQCGRLAGGAAGDKNVCSLLDMPIDKMAKGRLI